MLEALFSGLVQAVSWPAIFYMIIGVLIGNMIGFLPGLGGTFALSILLPFTFKMDVVAGIAFLLGAHAVINTGSSLSAILFNTPGSVGSAATVFDGYELTKKGQAGRAIGASLAGSAVGGVFGALCLTLLIPVVRPIVMSFGAPEFFMLSLLGISMIAMVGTEAPLKSIIAGVLGLLLSTVGLDQTTATPRFTFGMLYLWNGLSLVPAVIGLFAITEMMELVVSKRAFIVQTQEKVSNTWSGVVDVFRHWSLTLRASAIGTIVGLVPGIGSETANFLAYGHAVQTSKHPEEFGHGSIEGVIAPESANNSKEGGVLLPTVAFGIPGSGSMAVLLGAFMIWGIQPGPDMLKDNLSLVFVMVWTLVISSILGAMILLPLGNLACKLGNIRNSVLVPLILVLATLGAYATNNALGDVILAYAFGAFGYLMKKLNYSRAVLLIGLVLGGIAESNFNLSVRLYGLNWLGNTAVVVILIMIVVSLLFPLYQAQRRRAGRAGGGGKA